MVNAHVEYDGSKLAAALIKFQADLPDIGLDSENPHFKSKFASLPKITKVVLPLLAANGLSFTAGGVMQDGQFGLSATLLHESGEERSGFFPIIATDPQKIGSAITYARRYLLASLTGIVADADDDGNAASLPTRAEQTASTAQARVAKAQGNAPKSSGRNELNDLNTAIRKYIGTDEEKKKSVNGLLEQFKKGGLNAVGQRNKIIQELELEETLAEVQSGKFDGGV